MRTKIRTRRGIALIWVVLFLMLFLGFIGLALDTARMVLVHHELQNAADAAALAGARWVRINQTQARTAAKNFSFANYAGTNGDADKVFVDMDLNTANAVDGDIVLGRYSRLTGIFDPTHASKNAVKAVARRSSIRNSEQPLLFGSVLSATESAGATREAVAYLAGGLGAGLLVLHPTQQCSLTISGNSTTSVLNGSIQVNSNHPQAACVTSGSSIVIGDEMNVTGGTSFHQNATMTVGNINTGMPIIPDPLAWLPNPTIPAAAPGSTVSGTTRTLYPGLYPNGIKTTGNEHFVFQPGIYYIGTPGGNQQLGLDLNGGASITALGVFFYVAAGATEIGANTRFNIQAMENSGTSYDHITVFQSRTNNSASRINGNSDSSMTGTLYFPNNHCNLIGGGGNFGTQVIASTLDVSGNGVLNIMYDGAFDGSLANRVMLVK